VPSQVEQRDLLHLAVNAFGAHQAVSEIGFAGGVTASLSASYRDACQITATTAGAQVPSQRLWHYFSDTRGFMKLRYI